MKMVYAAAGFLPNSFVETGFEVHKMMKKTMHTEQSETCAHC